MTDSVPVKVLLIDDQALIRVGFRLVLESEPDITVVGEAGDGAVGLQMASALAPDVALMDIRMPNMDGIEATRRIVAQCPEVKVLVLTTFDLDEYAFAALRAGASGFLLKDARPADLVSAVRTVHSGEAVVSARITRRLLEMFGERLPDAGADLAATPGGKLGDLTDREMEVLTAVAEGLTNAEIAERLFLSPTTVKTHVSRILTKLDARDRVQLVVLAYESGIVTPRG